MNSNVVIKCEKVSKIFSGSGKITTALENITFSIKRRSFVFLTGASGAGKTTLTKLLYGEHSPSSGELIVCGKNLSKANQKQIMHLRRQVGIIHQAFYLIQDKSVLDNIALPLIVKGINRKKALRNAEEMLELVRLNSKAKHPVITLSDGEKQRTAIARALIIEPELIVADEPTGNLDPILSNEIFSIFEEVCMRGATIIVATHDLKRVETSKHSVIYLESGKIKAVRDDIEAVIK